MEVLQVVEALYATFTAVRDEVKQRSDNIKQLISFKEYLENIENILRKLDDNVRRQLEVETLRQMNEAVESVLDMLQKSSSEGKFRRFVVNPLIGQANKVKECVNEARQNIMSMMQTLQLDVDVTASNYKLQIVQLQSEQDPEHSWKVDGQTLNINTQTILGKGGFAITYRGTLKGSPVAVKVPHQHVLAEIDKDPKMLSRFQREVHNLFKIHHPNVVSIYGGIGREGTPGKQCVIIMELLDHTLKEEIKNPNSQLRRSQEERLRMCWDSCKALGFLHSFRDPILHRDLNLVNVMLDASGTIKLIDFGNSKELTPGAAHSTQVCIEVLYALKFASCVH